MLKSLTFSGGRLLSACRGLSRCLPEPRASENLRPGKTPVRGRVGFAAARSEARVVEQKRLTKGRAALLLILSALGAIVSATMLHGWHVYLGFAIVGISLFLGFFLWNLKY